MSTATPKLSVTLWPSFPHFTKYAKDKRLASIRLNSAMMPSHVLEDQLTIVKKLDNHIPLYFDVKARQPRVAKAVYFEKHLELYLTHPISIKTPTPILFKAGTDEAVLDRLEDGGKRLVLQPFAPSYTVKEGESVHFRHPSYQMLGDVFTDQEKVKIEIARKAGFNKFYLSYVEDQKDVDEFLELVGRDSEVMLKIETVAGLNYALTKFVKKPNLTLVAARGDLYVELRRPHQIVRATKEIIQKDPEACVGSRILLSCVNKAIPECADFSELAWLHDIGYRHMLLCDELCLKEELLDCATHAFHEFMFEYGRSLRPFAFTYLEQKIVNFSKRVYCFT